MVARLVAILLSALPCNATAPAAQAWLTAWTESKKGEGGEAPRGVAPLFLRTLRSTDGASTALSYLLADADTREAVVIDAVDAHAGRDAALVRELGLSLTFAVDTAAATGHAALARATGCRNLAPAGAADGRLRDGDAVVVGRHALRVLSAPGATPASLSLVLDDETRPGAFTGGGLLARGCGRADSEGGSAAQLCRSVVGRVFTLPDRYAVLPARAHGGMTESTVGEEKAHIPLLGGGKTDAECVAAAAALTVSACQKAEEKAEGASHEAAPAAGVADPAAANTRIDQAAADAKAAADAAAAAELAPAAAGGTAPAPEADAPAAPAPAAAAPAAAH